MIILKEFAQPKKAILTKLFNHSEEEKEHLLKLYYYRDLTRYLNGWLREVRAYLGSVSRQKENSKFPSFEDIYDVVWKNDEKEFKKFHQDSVDSFPYMEDEQGDCLPPVTLDPKAEGFCRDYIRWVSKILSQTGGVSIPLVKEKIEELWQKYPYTRV